MPQYIKDLALRSNGFCSWIGGFILEGQLDHEAFSDNFSSLLLALVGITTV